MGKCVSGGFRIVSFLQICVLRALITKAERDSGLLKLLDGLAFFPLCAASIRLPCPENARLCQTKECTGP